MVKIGVISDTHGLLREEVLKILRTATAFFTAGISTTKAFWMRWEKSRRSMWFEATTTGSGRSNCPMT